MGEWRYNSSISQPSTLYEGEWWASGPSRFNFEESMLSIGQDTRWLTDMDAVENTHLPPHWGCITGSNRKKQSVRGRSRELQASSDLFMVGCEESPLLAAAT